MSEFSVSHKTNHNYIDRAANGNGSEKSLLTMEAISRLNDAARSEIHIAEIGPGGGAAVAALAKELSRGRLTAKPSMSLSLIELDGVSSQSLNDARDEFSAHGETTMIAGDARKLDSLIPEKADVVAASAVLHEVYSYAGGYTAIDETVSAITNTLRPGGYFAYRDVFSVEHAAQHDRAKHVYDQESWVRFSKLFLPYYLKNAEHPYHRQDDRVIFEQDSQKVAVEDIDPKRYLGISAPIGLLRELQRHYITMRDYVWRNGSLGITPILEGKKANDWLDLKNGHKRVHYVSELDDKLLDVLSEDDSDGHRVVDGDAFDASTDVLLAQFLREVSVDNPSSLQVWNEWLQREGSETYVYMTIGKLLGSVALTSLEASNGQQILIPTKPQDVLVTPRAYYNRFLRGQLSNPLYDGKQLILFQSVNVEKDADKVAQSLDIISDHCAKNTIAEIYSPIRKVMN